MLRWKCVVVEMWMCGNVDMEMWMRADVDVEM